MTHNQEGRNGESEVLSPCPFCGGQAREFTGRTGDGLPFAYVMCEQCNISTITSTDISAMRAQWNSRTPPPRPAAGDGEYQPCERDEGYDRGYITMPGGWEIQTQGRGSSFRIANETEQRLNVPDSPYLRETLTKTARDVHAAWKAQSDELAKLRAQVESLSKLNEQLRGGLHPNYYHCDKCGWDYVSTHTCTPRSQP